MTLRLGSRGFGRVALLEIGRGRQVRATFHDSQQCSSDQHDLSRHLHCWTWWSHPARWQTFPPRQAVPHNRKKKTGGENSADLPLSVPDVLYRPSRGWNRPDWFPHPPGAWAALAVEHAPGRQYSTIRHFSPVCVLCSCMPKKARRTIGRNGPRGVSPDEHGLESWRILLSGTRIRFQTVAHVQDGHICSLTFAAPEAVGCQPLSVTGIVPTVPRPAALGHSRAALGHGRAALGHGRAALLSRRGRLALCKP